MATDLPSSLVGYWYISTSPLYLYNFLNTQTAETKHDSYDSRFAVFCCVWLSANFTHTFQGSLTSIEVIHSPGVNEATLKNMGKCILGIHYENTITRWNKTQQTVFGSYKKNFSSATRNCDLVEKTLLVWWIGHWGDNYTVPYNYVTGPNCWFRCNTWLNLVIKLHACKCPPVATVLTKRAYMSNTVYASMNDFQKICR